MALNKLAQLERNSLLSAELGNGLFGMAPAKDGAHSFSVTQWPLSKLRPNFLLPPNSSRLGRCLPTLRVDGP